MIASRHVRFSKFINNKFKYCGDHMVLNLKRLDIGEATLNIHYRELKDEFIWPTLYYRDRNAVYLILDA